MSKMPGFIGPSYTARNPQFDCSRTVNMYLSVDENQSGDDQQTAQLLSTPGLTNAFPTSTLNGYSCRGGFTASNGQGFFVCGSTLYAINGTQYPFTATAVGILLTNRNKVRFADNGQYLVVVDGPYGYYYDMLGQTFAQITDPAFYGASFVVFYDGYFIFNKPDTGLFYWTDPNAITFNALNFATKSGNADPIAGMVVFQRQLWLIGTQTSEIWYDVGGTVTFQRLQGPYNELGCIAPDTIATSDEAVYFVATSQRSGPYVVRSYGNSTQRVSSLPVDLALGSYGQSLISATGFTYNQDGSSFYAINPKNGTSSWYFDETMATLLGAMAPAWAERTYTLPPGTPVGYGLAPGVEVRHLADNHWFYANQYHLVGDYNSPNVYFFDFSNGTDNNAWITRTRQAPHVASERNRIFYYNFRLICQVGVGVGTGPLVNVAATSNTSTANLVLAANVVPGGCTSIGFSSNSGIGVGTFGTLTPNTFNGKNIIGLIETESFGGNAAAFDLYVTDSAATLTQNSYFTSFSFVDRHSNTQTYNANTATFTNPNPILGVAHWNWVPPFQIVYDSFGGAGGDMLITTNVVFSIVTSSPSIYISTSSNPTVSLSWSDDGGFNWSDEITQSIGQVGDYTRVVDFRALGEGRNRAFRVRTSGYAAFNLIDVDLNMYVSPVQ